ncbi:MAG TPA: hypothetical protein VER04_07645, partial [Polyangiaceae bacterium]|nr:hypothetical protein [Polyangiaceae bacterium]
GWFELGLGAYDASTTLRPGLYVGGAFGELESVRVSGHFGAHLVNGLCCSTVPHGGLRGEVGLDHAFTQKVSAGASVAFSGDLVVEGNAHVTFAL